MEQVLTEEMKVQKQLTLEWGATPTPHQQPCGEHKQQEKPSAHGLCEKSTEHDTC